MPRSKPSEAAAEWVSVAELKAWQDNPRKNDGRPVEEVKRSIKRFGFGENFWGKRLFAPPSLL